MPQTAQPTERFTETINLGPFTLTIEYQTLSAGGWCVSWNLGDCPKNQKHHDKPLETRQQARKLALTEAKEALGSQVDKLCQALSTLARTRGNT